MKRWPKIIMLIILFSALTLTLACPVSAINGLSNRATLRGIKGVGVLVEKLSPEVEQQGLRRNELQKAVESKLQRAGIKVLTKTGSLAAPGEPYLYININVNIAKTESDIYPYSIDLLFTQKVSLVRDPKSTTYAVTWSTSGVGSITKRFVDRLQESVENMVDIFIRAYLAENPK
jgi:hypothetical protein